MIMEKTYCDITEEDLNILYLASKFAERHDAAISFTVCGLSGCDVHMGKNGCLETVTIPSGKLETIDRDYIKEVLNHLLTRLETKDKYDEIMRARAVEQITKWAEEEEENA